MGSESIAYEALWAIDSQNWILLIRNIRSIANLLFQIRICGIYSKDSVENAERRRFPIGCVAKS